MSDSKQNAEITAEDVQAQGLSDEDLEGVAGGAETRIIRETIIITDGPAPLAGAETLA